MLEKIKKEIQEKLIKYVENTGSQNQAAATLEGVSSATVSQILNNNWELIADVMWKTVGMQIGWTQKKWQIAETNDLKLLNVILNDSKDNANVYGIVGAEGTGKSEAFKLLKSENSNVFHIKGNQWFTSRFIFEELHRMMGKETGRETLPHLARNTIKLLEKLPSAIIIFDEADKLPDKVLSFFITLYNELEDKVGIIIAATPHLKKKIENGCAVDKLGYRELHSRLGKNFIELGGLKSTDVINIAAVNGVHDKKTQRDIVKTCNGDIRRIKKYIHGDTLRVSLQSLIGN